MCARSSAAPAQAGAPQKRCWRSRKLRVGESKRVRESGRVGRVGESMSQGVPPITSDPFDRNVFSNMARNVPGRLGELFVKIEISDQFRPHQEWRNCIDALDRAR